MATQIARKPCIYCGERTYLRTRSSTPVAMCFACLERSKPSVNFATLPTRPKGCGSAPPVRDKPAASSFGIGHRIGVANPPMLRPDVAAPGLGR